MTHLQSERVYVDQNAIGNGTGSSWTNAYTSIKDTFDDETRGKKKFGLLVEHINYHLQITAMIDLILISKDLRYMEVFQETIIPFLLL